MPLRHKSAQKRARQAKKRTERNKAVKTVIKSSVKKLVATKDKATAESELKKTTAILDRAAAKGIIHKNKAANKKSELAKRVKKLS